MSTKRFIMSNFFNTLAANCPSFGELVIDISCMILPTVGYLDQIKQMITNKNADNFKMGSSIVLLVSNCLRIYYWIRQPFETYLLLQSIWMLGVQCTLICLNYIFSNFEDDQSKLGIDVEVPQEGEIKEKRNFTLRLGKATNSFNFVLAFALNLLSAVAIFFFLSHFLGGTVITNVIGILANTVDCFVTLPQFILICIRRDISYVTPLLVLQWFAAVAMKAGLYMWRPVPWPFILGLGIQALFTLCLTYSYVDIKFCTAANTPKDEEPTTDTALIDQKDIHLHPMFAEIESDSLQMPYPETTVSQSSSLCM